MRVRACCFSFPLASPHAAAAPPSSFVLYPSCLLLAPFHIVLLFAFVSDTVHPRWLASSHTCAHTSMHIYIYIYLYRRAHAHIYIYIYIIVAWLVTCLLLLSYPSTILPSPPPSDGLAFFLSFHFRQAECCVVSVVFPHRFPLRMRRSCIFSRALPLEAKQSKHANV